MKIGWVITICVFFSSSGVTDTILKLLGNEPSANDGAASRVITGANTPMQDLMIAVGIVSIGDDFAGIKLINLLTSKLMAVERHQLVCQ